MSAAREQNYITEARLSAKKLWEAVNELVALQREWSAQDYGTTLDDGAAGGTNAGYLAADIGAVVFATTDAIVSLLDSGHATNIAKLL